MRPLIVSIYIYIYAIINELMFYLFTAIEEAKSKRGLALEDIVTELHLFIMRRKHSLYHLEFIVYGFYVSVELPMSVMNKLIVKLAQVEERLSKGCSEAAQTAALVSAFFISRDMVSLES